jgi:TldD protein
MARDVQPMMRFGVRAVAEDGGKRQSGSSGGGGRFGLEYFDQPGKDAASHAARPRGSPSRCSTRARRPPARWRWCSAPGDSGILLHEAVGHGLEADFNRKGVSNYSGRSARPWRAGCAPWSTAATSTTSRGSINVDDEGNVGRNVLIENGVLVGYLHDT